CGSAAGLGRRPRAAPDVARVRSAGLLYAQSRPGAAARAVAQRSLGRAGLESLAHTRGSHPLAAPEGRARPGPANLHPDGAADRVSLRRALVRPGFHASRVVTADCIRLCAVGSPQSTVTVASFPPRRI